jgi:hypothetical protein
MPPATTRPPATRSTGPTARLTRRRLALAALACYAVHAAVHLRRGEPYDLLWACHLAVLLVAAGLWFQRPTLNAVGLLWACFGLPIWLLDAFTGTDFMPTGTLTHVGALVIGLCGVRLLGFARGSAWKALAAYLGLWGLTRAVTPPSANINLAFHVHTGWEQRFPSYPAYFALLLVAGALTFAIAELGLSHIAGGRPPEASA